MLQSWKEVLPGDHYLVRANGHLQPDNQQVLISLYQPLIGLEAVSLYLTYWQERAMGANTVSVTHHHLMALLNLSLDRILLARKKLEAVGLLKTLKKKEQAPAFFVYQLMTPVTAQAFFANEVLAAFLCSQVGNREYERLQQFFADELLPEGEFDDLSATFDKVFDSMPSGLLPSMEEQAAASSEIYYQPVAAPVQFQKRFNFKALRGYLSDAILSEDALTAEVCDVIEKLAFIYQTDPFDMSRAVEAAALHTGIVDLPALRDEVRDFYQIEHGPGEQPALVTRTQPVKEQTMVGKQPQTEEEKLIAWYETISPYQLLQQLANGGKPTATELRLVEGLLIDMKLNAGVINVLLHYISMINDHNLNKSFVETIASTWARAHIRTVPQAMALARKEKRKRDSLRKSGTRKAAGNGRSQSQHREVVPEWMKKEKSHDQPSQQTVTPEEAEKRAQWLKDYLGSI
ncbi:MAG: DnaD domain protein [Sporolactobacillus sp.]